MAEDILLTPGRIVDASALINGLPDNEWQAACLRDVRVQFNEAYFCFGKQKSLIIDPVEGLYFEGAYVKKANRYGKWTYDFILVANDNKEADKAFDTSRVFLRDENLDEEIERRLAEARLAGKGTQQLDQIFLSLDKQAFADETVPTLASAPVAEYIRIFKTYDGDELRTILAGVFQYSRVGNATDDMKTIVSKSREALVVIGQESKLNAERVKEWGITISTNRTAQG
ncbi:hypothetical protein [Rhizobium lusitanum]|uniref:Uncharacterized protein n=1 Tax=Rhizobium lusitanum TaxID=293958 RepID=A0A7X0IVF1_9HYPH|nr:hypothetical protein [Rhizobium lusitanum]MBB6487931.1 hypothetical protein [Rhizobium lusitanum]